MPSWVPGDGWRAPVTEKRGPVSTTVLPLSVHPDIIRPEGWHQINSRVEQETERLKGGEGSGWFGPPKGTHGPGSQSKGQHLDFSKIPHGAERREVLRNLKANDTIRVYHGMRYLDSVQETAEEGFDPDPEKHERGRIYGGHDAAREFQQGGYHVTPDIHVARGFGSYVFEFDVPAKDLISPPATRWSERGVYMTHEEADDFWREVYPNSFSPGLSQALGMGESQGLLVQPVDPSRIIRIWHYEMDYDAMQGEWIAQSPEEVADDIRSGRVKGLREKGGPGSGWYAPPKGTHGAGSQGGKGPIHDTLSITEETSIGWLRRERWEAHEQDGFKYILIIAQDTADPDLYNADLEYSRVIQAKQYTEDMIRQNPDLIKRMDSDGDLMVESVQRGENERIGLNLVFTTEKEYFGAGSAGIGESMKVFYGPYTPEARANIPDHYQRDLGVDPLYVTIHELHHALGSGTELDTFSDVMAIGFHYHLGNTLNPTGVSDKLRSVVRRAHDRASGEYRDFILQDRAAVRWLYNNYPEQISEWMYENYGDADKVLARIGRW